MWLDRTCEALDGWLGIRVTERSPDYETEPVGVPEEFAHCRFVNRIVIAETDLTAQAFSDAVHEIERRLGRARGTRRSLPRTVDIDVVAFGDLIQNAPDLTLPHPRATARRFVLQPLADLRPALILPGERLTVAELLDALPETPLVSRLPGTP